MEGCTTYHMQNLEKVDKKIYQLIKAEEKRQKYTLMMIPSENYAPRAVREAVGSVLTNKYSEGQVKKRYYQGNKVIDSVEQLCKQRALQAFRLNPEEWGVNVQAYSGTPANVAVFVALLEPGDRIMPMYLPDGGHLSHGWMFKGKKITLTSKIYDIQYYHVDRTTKVFDYGQIKNQAEEFRPKILISGGTAYPQEIDHRAMGKIARGVGAYYLADIAHEAGLVAGGANKPPFAHADVVTMTTHKTLRGPRGAIIIARKELIDKINRAVFPGFQGGPHNHTIAGIAVALKIAASSKFRSYAHQVVKNAKVLAEELTDYGYDLVSGGTAKHLILVDLRNKGLSGVIPALALEYAGIVVNFNTVPYDIAPPLYPSGLRMGTPGVTTRGMRERQMRQIAKWVDDVIKEVSEYRLPDKGRKEYIQKISLKLASNGKLADIARKVRSICKQFPVP